MFKSFWLTLLRFVTVSLLAVSVLVSTPLLAETSASPEASPAAVEQRDQPDASGPSETESGSESDREPETGDRSSQPTPSRSAVNPPASPYNMEKIKRFDDELYGT